jgi:hypothetical protein
MDGKDETDDHHASFSDTAGFKGVCTLTQHLLTADGLYILYSS